MRCSLFVQDMERSRESSGGGERGRKRPEDKDRSGGRPEGRDGSWRPEERSRGNPRYLERGSSKRSDEYQGSSRETEGRDGSRGREWGRGADIKERSSSGVSTMVGSGGGGGSVDNKEVWEAPWPGEWQAVEGTGVPSWDRSKLKEEENPPDWVEPPQPKVDLSLSLYKMNFEAEVAFPPVETVEKERKDELLHDHRIPEDEPIVVIFARGVVRTTRRGLKESKQSRVNEEREIEQMLTERGFFRGGRGRGRGRGGFGGRGRGGSQLGRGGDQGGFNSNMEPVAGIRGYGGSRDADQGADRGSREMGRSGDEGSSRQGRDVDRGNSRDGRSGERSVDRPRDGRGDRGNDRQRDGREENWEDARRTGESSHEARCRGDRGGEGPGGRDGVRREGGSSQSLEARHGGQSGHQGPGGREDFSGRVHDVNEKPEERSSGQRSGGAMPGESYKEFKARREQEKKKKSAGQ